MMKECPMIKLKEYNSFLNIFKKCWLHEKTFGSNYVSAKIAMSMKGKDKNREVVGIIDDDVNY